MRQRNQRSCKHVVNARRQGCRPKQEVEGAQRCRSFEAGTRQRRKALSEARACRRQMNSVASDADMVAKLVGLTVSVLGYAGTATFSRTGA